MTTSSQRKARRRKIRQALKPIIQYSPHIEYDKQTIQLEKADNWLNRLFLWLAYSSLYKYRKPQDKPKIKKRKIQKE